MQTVIDGLANFFRMAGGSASFELMNEHGFSPYALVRAGLIETAPGAGRWCNRFAPSLQVRERMQAIESGRALPA